MTYSKDDIRRALFTAFVRADAAYNCAECQRSRLGIPPQMTTQEHQDWHMVAEVESFARVVAPHPSPDA